MFQSATSVDTVFPNKPQREHCWRTQPSTKEEDAEDCTSTSNWLESPGACITTDELAVVTPLSVKKKENAPSFVDAMEVVIVEDVGPKTTLENPQAMRRPQSPCWLLDSSRRRISGGNTSTWRQQQHADMVVNGSSELWIDPASIASLYHPGGIDVGNLGRNHLKNPSSSSSSGVWTNPTRMYPDATPMEWQRLSTPEIKSRKRVAELVVDDAAKPPGKRVYKRTAVATSTVTVVEPSAKKRTMRNEDKWQRKFELLCAFRGKNGHCRVPKEFINDSVQLGQWVRNQRKSYVNYMEGKYSPMTKERISQLNSIGFEWRRADTWQHKFELLCTFQRENGHCRVTQSYIADSVKLGQWVRNQRYCFKNRKDGKKRYAFITGERISQLNSIGFEWRVDEVTKSGT